MNSLEIDLQVLPFGRSTLQLEALASELDIARDQYEFRDSLTVELEVVKAEREILFSGWIAARARAECSRCLAAFEERARAPFSLTCLLLSSGDVSPEGDEGGECSRFIPSEAARLDLTEDIRSALILELPIRPLCREDCRGLCPRCGRDLNQESCDCPPVPKDERWKALEALRGTGKRLGDRHSR
jgi:uncharacterized protein